ncbi:MAG: UvrD-helicase domain-containing protein, partial [Flavobacteriaceae bacterium]|nr:UvrD-helicase domain-containing protein [Flavobacteriaceae bacterium]
GYFYDFLTNISSEKFNLNLAAGWQNNLEDKPLYPSRVDASEAALIDELAPQLIAHFYKMKELLPQLWLYENIAKNIIPLATIHVVNQELQQIKEDENILPIHEFNALIHEEIKDQPVPFIYERLGDRYRHFFIDEFQDTSKLQWKNLIPLVDNALSQQYTNHRNGSLLLVGDAKQSIYRFRGGLPEQFINLYQGHSPFSISEENINIENLDTNFRSFSEIIIFNNDFFSWLSNYFGEPVHTGLYKLGNEQKTTQKLGGYVKIEFIEDDKETFESTYAEKTLATIHSVIALGFRKRDICILTRKKKEGIAISKFLLENNVEVISEETLLLQHSEIVQGIIYTFQLAIQPNNEEIKVQWLQFVHQLQTVPNNLHDFLSANLSKTTEEFTEVLKALNIEFEFSKVRHLPLYQAGEYIINQLKLNSNADAFLVGISDLIFNFSNKQKGGIPEFLEYWEVEKEKANISENKNADAVQIMTVHKAKGLEFPVVIFPYADLDIYREIDPVSWYPFGDSGFEELLVNFKKELKEYGSDGEFIYNLRRNTLELDNINLLYVALTRAIQHLYIFAKDTKINEQPSTYNSFFKTFFEADDSLVFERGDANFFNAEMDTSEILAEQITYPVSMLGDRNIRYVSKEILDATEERAQAVRLGNLVHDAMALIIEISDKENVLTDLKVSLADDPTTFALVNSAIESILNHEELSALFDGSDDVYAEKDIISSFGVLRPDRINISENRVTLLDYKTGVQRLEHEDQISGYAAALQDMGFEVEKKLLVYTNAEEILINKV